MIGFHKTPSILPWMFPNRLWKKKSGDAIFLTFDDGPDPAVTPWVLEELDRVGAKSTFFCVGRNLEANRSLAKDLVSKGHLFGNHTFSHLNGWNSVDSDYLADVNKCSEILKSMEAQTSFFRPPFGRIKQSQARKLDHMKIVMWSHLAWDFASDLNVSMAFKRLKEAQPGSIITFHDSRKAFRNLKSLLPVLLDHYYEKGLKFRTLTDD